MRRDELSPNERVCRWWDAGIGMDLQALTIVRVNRVTATVRTDQGNVFRIPFADLARHIRTDENF